MRQERTIQATIFEVFAQHEIGCEPKAMSAMAKSTIASGRAPSIDDLAKGDRPVFRRSASA